MVGDGRHVLKLPTAFITWGVLYVPDGHYSDTGYPHDGRADYAAYQHDRRADKRRYPHDGEIEFQMLKMIRSGYILS